MFITVQGQCSFLYILSVPERGVFRNQLKSQVSALHGIVELKADFLKTLRIVFERKKLAGQRSAQFVVATPVKLHPFIILNVFL